MKEKFNEKVIPIILKFINTKGIQSIKNGMVTSMSPLIIGSIFLILSNFPVKAVVDVLESTGIKAVLDQACGATFSISAMIAVIGISYSYAKLENQEPLNCAIISLASFLILMPSSITTESGEVVTGIINKTWTAGQGMIGAIIVGLIVPLVYCWFLKKNIRIKMPAGVPEGVTNAFSALIPAFVILTGTAVIHGICSIGFNTTAVNAEHIASRSININAVALWIVFCKYRSHRIKSPYRSINHLLQKSEVFQSVPHVTFILCYTIL